jgi:hypothetical protein
MMVHTKNSGFLIVDMYMITQLCDEPYSKLSNEIYSDIVTVLAKHNIVTDHININFLESNNCEQKDILHLALIEAGKRIQAGSISKPINETQSNNKMDKTKK